MAVAEPEQAADPAEPGHGPRDGPEGIDQLHAAAAARRRQRGSRRGTWWPRGQRLGQRLLPRVGVGGGAPEAQPRAVGGGPDQRGAAAAAAAEGGVEQQRGGPPGTIVVNDRIMDLKDPLPLQFYDRIRERRHISKEGKNDRLKSVSIRSS